MRRSLTVLRQALPPDRAQRAPGHAGAGAHDPPGGLRPLHSPDRPTEVISGPRCLIPRTDPGSDTSCCSTQQHQMAGHSPQEAAWGRLGLFARLWGDTAGHFSRPAPPVGSLGQTSARPALLQPLKGPVLWRSWLFAKCRAGKLLRSALSPIPRG